MFKWIANLFGGFLILVGTISYYTQDWVEYECNETTSNSFNWEKVYLYKKGSVHTESYYSSTSNTSTFGFKHTKVEGDKYISYLRQGNYSYKLNKEDLTYYARLGDDYGQCIKIGLLKSIELKSFESKTYDINPEY